MPDAPDLLIAVDPGGTVGLAAWTPTGKIEASERDPMTSLDQIYDALGVLTSSNPKARPEIVAERFTIDQRTLRLTRGGSHDALDVLGGLRWIAHSYGIPLELQGVAEVKNLVPDTRLRALGLHKPTPGGHANDALRHLVYRLARLKLMELPT